MSCGTALQCAGDGKARAKRVEAVAETSRHDAPERGAERAHEPGLDHVQAPGEQCNAACEMKHDSDHLRLLFDLQPALLSPAAAGNQTVVTRRLRSWV